MELIKRVIKSATDDKNQGLFGICTIGGLGYGVHFASIIPDSFLTGELIWKGLVGVFTVMIAPPLGVFMSDVYKVQIRPKIKFLNKKNP